MGINASNQIQTVWQRRGDIYFAQDAEPEVYIGKGKTCSLTTARGKTFITYQNNDTLKLVTLPDKTTNVIGRGNSARSVQLKDNSNFFVWEQGNDIQYSLH